MSDMRVTVNPAESFESLDSLDDKPKHKRTESKSKKDRKKKKDWFVSNRFKQSDFQAHPKLVQKMSHILRYLEFCPCQLSIYELIDQFMVIKTSQITDCLKCPKNWKAILY